MTRDVPLFGLPDEPPIAAAKSLREIDAASRPQWSRYRVRNRVPCDECITVLHEHNGKGPYANSARWKCTVDGHAYLLCHQHADLHRAKEPKK